MVETSSVVLFANVEKICQLTEEDLPTLFNTFAQQVNMLALEYPLDTFKLKQHLCSIQKLENTTSKLKSVLKNISCTIEQSKSNALHELSIDLLSPKRMSKKLKNAEKNNLPDSQECPDLLLQTMRQSELA